MISTLFEVFSDPVVIFVFGWAVGIYLVIVVDWVARKRKAFNLEEEMMAKKEMEKVDSPVIKTLGALEPGKVYVLQVNFSVANMQHLEQIAKYLVKEGIRFIVIGSDMNFVSVPEGYELIKSKK